MKKPLSFLMALIAVLSMNLSAFALETTVQNETAEEITVEINENSELSLGAAEDGELTLSGLLTPNQKLRFPILLNGQQLKSSDMEGKRIRLETEDGRSAVQTIKIAEDDGLYFLDVNTLSGYPTKIVNYSGKITATEKSTGKELHVLPLSFSAGYAAVSEEAVNAAKEGDFLMVDNFAPVITDKQFDAIDKVANGEKITISGGDWTYEVRVTGQPSVNMLHSERVIKEIVSQFENQEFKFLSFPAGSAFDFTGTMTIDVSAEMEDFGGKFYVYSYYNGKLNKVYANYNEDEGTLSFPTKYMGRFVITDKEIKNGTVIEDCSPDCDDSVSTPTKPNPSTGAGTLPVDVAAAMAGLSASVIALLGMKK